MTLAPKELILSGFNRTFMELKHVVVPSQLPYVACFNRTFMELKQLGGRHNAQKRIRFNRTFMELKPVKRYRVGCVIVF